MSTLFKKFLLVSALLSAANGCKDDESAVEPEQEHVGEVRPVGAALGNAESFSIGPDGGTINFADGLVEINIPAGALTTVTSIQVESIENTCSAGLGNSFRFTPHNHQFEKPVTLTFSYKSIPVSFEDGLAIAYQEDDGIWYWPGNLVRDKDQNTVSVDTDHFSDWTLFESMRLEPRNGAVEPNEEVIVTAYRYLPEDDIASLLAPLVETSTPISVGEAVNLEQKYIKEWSLIGEGALSPAGSSATYHAPAVIPDQNTITVSLEVNLKNARKAFLLSHITIGSMYITLNGGPYSNVTIAANVPGWGQYAADKNTSVVWFSGVDDARRAIVVTVVFPGRAVGQFAWDETCLVATDHQFAGTATVIGRHLIPSDPVSVHPGHIRISEYGEVAGTISGTFEGNFTFIDSRCQPAACVDYGTVKGMFVVRRF